MRKTRLQRYFQRTREARAINGYAMSVSDKLFPNSENFGIQVRGGGSLTPFDSDEDHAEEWLEDNLGDEGE